MLLLASFVLAAETEVFLGGGVALRPAWAPSTDFTLGGEVEGDFRLARGIFSTRVDLDVQAQFVPSFGILYALPDVVPINVVRPEWASVQLGGETWMLRGGIVNSSYGLEDWDDWALYLPTHAQYFIASPGRMAGGEAGYAFENGLALTVGGGMDLDFAAPIIDATINYENDSFGTWSGVAVYPSLALYEAIVGAEVWPAEQLTLAFGGMAGTSSGSPFAMGSLYAVALPEAIVNPTVRVEGALDPDGVQGLSPWNVSLGGAVSPTPYIKVLVEGKLSGTSGAPEPGVYASLCVFRPEEE